MEGSRSITTAATVAPASYTITSTQTWDAQEVAEAVAEE
jgi:hypothetical protein